MCKACSPAEVAEPDVNYEQIFDRRGTAYDRAMERWPEARREDLLVPLGWLDPLPGETIVDVPAGGGYLQRYLPSSCRWLGHEPCASFNANEPNLNVDLLPLPWSDSAADAAISIAGVHHLDDRRPLFRELRRVVKDHGRFVLADAHEASSVARFLDEFVGVHNSTGHTGNYLGRATLAELAASGWRAERAERVPLHWWFADRGSLAEFCRMLFDLRDVDDERIVDAVQGCLGLTVRDGAIGMNWELYLVAARPG